MKNKMTVREFVCRGIYTFAVEEEYKERLENFMEDHGVKFKQKDILCLPKVGWFFVYEIWAAGNIGPSKYVVENQLKILREETEKKVKD